MLYSKGRALREFDGAIPDLKLMRGLIQHLDDYGRDGSRWHQHPHTGQ
jgi:hypothetical protein